MRYFLLFFSFLSTFYNGISQIQSLSPDTVYPMIHKIAFGSCSQQRNPLPLFKKIAEANPDLWIYAGDNIYGDSHSISSLNRKYQKLLHNKNFKLLYEKTPIIATWDDHDYGINDGGKDYKMKHESKELFLTIFNEPTHSSRRNHAGIYASYYFKTGNKSLQIIMLDTRTFRDSIPRHWGSTRRYDAHSIESKASILGEEQWQWLEQELQKPAQIRMIVSSIQFTSPYSGYERWANFPGEQKRMIALLSQNTTKNIFFISGDVHYAEILKWQPEPLKQPIYELTSSGISVKYAWPEQHKSRLFPPFLKRNYGWVEFEYEQDILKNIIFQIRDIHNKPAQSIKFNLEP